MTSCPRGEQATGLPGQVRGRKVVLVHQGQIQHYRVAIYNYLTRYLAAHRWNLTVVSGGVEPQCGHDVEFELRVMPLGFRCLRRFFFEVKPQAVILFVNLRELYLFPLILFLKALRIPVVYWGHAIDLEDKNARMKRLAYALEHSLADAIILYGAALKQFVSSKHRHKVFIANNTLNTTLFRRRNPDRAQVFERYGIRTTRNIICVGRLQRRKGIGELLKAFRLLDDPAIGLVLVGPDVDHVMRDVQDTRIVWTGPLYGSAVQELMECADVYCMPGHVGLSIVDAFFFGLPLVTTSVEHAPEIMYLRHGVNGFILPKADAACLARTLAEILHDDEFRARLGKAAIETVRTEASINSMCRGFAEALSYVAEQSSQRERIHLDCG